MPTRFPHPCPLPGEREPDASRSTTKFCFPPTASIALRRPRLPYDIIGAFWESNRFRVDDGKPFFPLHLVLHREEDYLG
jgi:hypothetical protein